MYIFALKYIFLRNYKSREQFQIFKYHHFDIKIIKIGQQLTVLDLKLLNRGTPIQRSYNPIATGARIGGALFKQFRVRAWIKMGY